MLSTGRYPTIASSGDPKRIIYRLPQPRIATMMIAGVPNRLGQIRKSSFNFQNQAKDLIDSFCVNTKSCNNLYQHFRPFPADTGVVLEDMTEGGIQVRPFYKHT